MAGGNTVIGKLTLDISNVQTQIQKVNQLLQSIGAGVKIDLSSKVAKEVAKQLKTIKAELDKYTQDIKTAAKNATEAMDSIGRSNSKSSLGTLNSEITKTTSLITTMGRSTDAVGNTIETVVGEARTGFNSLGVKIREFTDANGNITRKVADIGAQYKEALKVMSEYYSKSAQIYNLQQNGQMNTPQYAKLVSEVGALQQAWSKIPPMVQAVVQQTDEAKHAATLYNNTIAAINAGLNDKNSQDALKNQVEMWKLYLQYSAQADTYAQKGNLDNAQMYDALANGIKSYINAVASLNPALDAQARAEKSVVQAQVERQKVLQDNAYKEQEEGIKQYTTALLDLLKAQTDFNNQVSTGKLVNGTQQYAEAEKNIDRLEAASIRAGQQISATNRQVAESSREVSNAYAQMKMSEAGFSDSAGLDTLNAVTTAYNNLKTAISNYTIAKKASNDAGMNSMQAEIDKQMNVITGIEQIVNSLNLEDGVRQQILAKIEAAKVLQDGFQKGVVGTTGSVNELETQINSIMMRLFSLMAVIRSINNLIQNTTEYVSEYYDKMNEIQMITLKTDAEVEKLGKTYRNIAEMMNVSSLDMADAAIYFTRQGLSAGEIENRLKNVTMYAKAANVEFKDASEIMTAVVNSMNLVEQEAEDGRNATERVADVFLKVGDSAATSGQEIGEAMQKAAASAGAFGVSFEWLSSAIATVSETTRQEARTIGTAFNTIIARMHQIKQNGYNQEDETKINDVAKALSKIDIALMDQAGNWRDMEDIWNEIASKWGDLDGKTKSYIATTMAGVKQQNVFLAAMNDMSKSIEEGGRFWDLYGKAMDSAGTAAEKYEVYIDSVTASQERLTIAQENFYSLMDASLIKGWNDFWADYINNVTNSAEALGGLNIIIPVFVGLLATVAVAIHGMNLQLKETITLTAMLEKHPIIMAIAAGVAVVSLLVTAISGLTSSIETTEQKFTKANTAFQETNATLKSLHSTQTKMNDMFDDLGSRTGDVTSELDRYNGVLNQLCDVSPTAKKVVEDFKEGLISEHEAATQLNDELEKMIENQTKVAKINLMEKYANWQPTETFNKSMDVYKTYLEGKFMSNISDYEGFIEAIKYDKRINGKYGGFFENFGFGDEYRETIQNAIKYIANGIEESDAWEIASRSLWKAIFGNDRVQQDFTSQITEMVDEAMEVLSFGKDDLQVATIRKKLMDGIFGDDGELSMDEYRNAGAKLSSMISTITISLYDEINYLTDQIYKDNPWQKMMSMLFFSNNDEMQQTIKDGYKNLLAMGFTEIDIQDLLRSIDFTKWENMVGYMHEKLLNDLEQITNGDIHDKIFGSDGEWDYDRESPTYSMWTELDIATLKLVKDMINAGESIEDIKQAMRDSDGDIDKFKESLHELAEDDGIDILPETQVKSFSDAIKDAQDSLKYIDKIDKALETIKKGEPISTDDILDLAKEHPELMMFTEDLETFKNKLLEIKKLEQESQRASLREAILNDPTIMANSEYAMSGFETLGAYIKAWRDAYAAELEGAEADEEVSKHTSALNYVNQMIDSLLGLSGAYGDSTEAAKSWLQEHVEAYKAAQELKKAEENNYKDQLSEMLTATNKKGVVSRAYNIWDKYTDDMKEAIGEMYPAVQEAMLKVEEAIKDPTKDMEGAAKNLAEVLAVAFASIPSDQLKDDMEKVEKINDDITNLDNALKTLNEGGTLSFDDLLNLASAHPEIFSVIGDLDALKAKLAELGAGSRESLKNAIKNMLMNSTEYFKTTKYYDAQNDKINNLKQFTEAEKDSAVLEAVTAEVNAAADNLASAAENIEKAADSWLQAQAKLAKQNADVNWAKSNGFIQQIEMLQQALDVGDESGALHVWKSFPKELREAFASEYPNIVQEMAKIEQAYTQKANEIKKKQEEIAIYNGNVDMYDRPIIDSHKLIDAGWDLDGYKKGDISTLYQSEQWAGKRGDVLQWNQDVIVSFTPIMENGKVLSPEEFNNYIDSLFESSTNTNELLANDKNGKNLIINITPVENGDFEGTQEKIDGITEQVHDLHEELTTTKLASSNLNQELEKSKRYSSSTYFKGTYDAIKKLANGTISATDAFETFNKEADKVAKAGEEINKVNSKMADKTEITTSDVNDLASVLNKSAEEILSNWPEAVKMFDDLRAAGEAAYNDLNREAVLRITGMSSADFSELQGGLLAIQSTAAATIAMLQATGQWEIATENLPQEGESFLPDGNGGGEWIHYNDTSQVTFLKPKSSNPFAKNGGNDLGGPKGGGGGGGGGGKKKSGMTEVEKALDRMDQYHTTQDWRKSYYQSQQNYYDQTGQVQGSIAYMKRQKQAINSQNKVLESNIAEIEKMMEQKKKELAGLKETDEKYEEVADDLDKLQKAHQNYTKKLVDNRTELEKLNDAIKEQRDRIRDMEINLRNEIYRAIEDRENKRKDKLNAQIEMEDKVLEVIKKRYEKERDMIIDSTNLKIESLEKERDLLSEQLELRKKQADQEEKNKKLMELEIQYQRIIADPTRAKEAQKIREQINELREEMAWDVAEEEVKAQQDALDQQIDSLEDYIEYVNNYYDEMFEHPKKLISEMKKILKMSDEEIIAWLEQNDEEYLNSTTKRQKQLKEQWQDMLDSCKGKIKTYWDEVEDIISKGDAYIIKFLKKNSDEYAKAGKQQAQKFVDEWKKQLEDLKKAHQQIAADIAKTYDYVPKGSGGSDNKNPGGGGSQKTKQYKFTYAKVEYKPFASEQAAIDKIEKLAKAEREQAGRNYPNGGTMYEYYYNLANEHARDAKKTVTAYKFGGLNFKTGLAWLDGTPDRPERILSAHQTEMFDSMVAALERMSRIAIPTMPDFGDMDFGNGSNVSVGDIIVNVDNLDTDDDYETLAEKVSRVLMERIGKTAVVGGIRIN